MDYGSVTSMSRGTPSNFQSFDVSPHSCLSRRLSSSSSVEITQTKKSSPAEEEKSENSSGGCGSCSDKPKDDQMEDDYTLQLQNLIRQLYHTAEYEQGLEASLELLKHCKSHFVHPYVADHHPVTASAHNNVALMHKSLGQFAEAGEHYQQAFDMYKSTLGDDHAHTATAMANLANLLRARVHYEDDQTLNVRQRREMLTKAVSLFEQALTIREGELGSDHPHAVTARSNLGATLAAQVLLDTHNGSSNVKPLKDIDPNSKLQHKEKQRLKLSTKQHEMAEHYLRSALRMAIQNQEKRRHQDKNGKQASRRKQQQQSTGGGLAEITTLSSASAAQSLAVYLKTTADRLSKMSPTSAAIKNNLSSDGGYDVAASIHSENPMELYSEAQWLYQGALGARRRILSDTNPDTLASMSSLAELKAAIGDEEGSLALRQEIMKIVEQEQEEEKPSQSSQQ
jgi:tetratricopeptide (TPR) repeat protein